MTTVQAIDTYVNVRMGSTARPEWLVRVAEDYFKRADAIFRDFSPAEMLEAMDAAGVKTSVLTLSSDAPEEAVLDFARHHPDRFTISVYVDPRRGMKAVRELDALARNEPVCHRRAVSSRRSNGRLMSTPPMLSAAAKSGRMNATNPS